MANMDFENGILKKYNEGCVVVPDGIVEIGDNAFERCESLRSIIIPNSVKLIGRCAFFGCTNLQSITIPESVIKIDSNAFNLCRGLKEINVSENNPAYTSVDGVLFNKDKSVLIDYPNCKSDVYEIPYGVTSIDDTAFLSKPNLTKIIIPDSLKSIGDISFLGCVNLTKISLSVDENISDKELEHLNLLVKKIFSVTRPKFD